MPTETSIEITKDGEIYSDFFGESLTQEFLNDFILEIKKDDVKFIKMNEGNVSFQNKNIVISFGLRYYPTKNLCSVKNVLSSMSFDETIEFIKKM